MSNQKKVIRKLRPVGHSILVKGDEETAKYHKAGTDENGNEIVFEIAGTPDSVKRAQVCQGEVVAVGPDAWSAFRKVGPDGKEVNGKPWAKVGDTVIFPPQAGRYVEDPDNKGEFFKWLWDEDVLLVIDEYEVENEEK